MVKMESENSLSAFHKVIIAQGAITLVVFATVISVAMVTLRKEIRSQVLERDAILLSSVSQHFYDRSDTGNLDIDLIDVLAESSELSGVIAVRIYNPNGSAELWIPREMYGTELTSTDLDTVSRKGFIARFHKRMHLYALFSDIDAMISEKTFPVTEVLSKINDADGKVVAIIQYWLDADAVATELADLDRSLILLGTAFLFAGGIIYLLVLGASRKRLLAMGTALAEKNRSLQEANAELAMAARTSAIGSITSHLFHDLKNPLAGLKSYLQVTGHDEEAVAMTNRMQSLINESLDIIRSKDSDSDLTLAMHEFQEEAERRVVRGHPNRVTLNASGKGEISSQKAMLLILVMRNLVENAVETGTGTSVIIDMKMVDGALEISVHDDGPGIPQEFRDRLFDPVASGKENGSGIGLVISSIIAKQIPAVLELLETSEHGTTFRIRSTL